MILSETVPLISPPMSRAPRSLSTVALLIVAAGCASTAARPTSTTLAGPRVGPPNGAVVVVGGGAIGPEILTRFIELAGGPDALIVDVPTAGGDSVYPPSWRGMNALKAAGARNIIVLHTKDRKVADSDEFAATIARAGGVWFEGGRQWHLVDSYGGTKTERAFHDVLARGGVVGGTSAGASILSSYMLRGARAGNETIMAPGYEVGFGFLRGVAIDQHVVARERLRDLADSLMPRRPDLLGISEDEGTAWIVRGDTAEILGRSKAFVYGGADPADERKPFLTLHPGDRYDLAARRVMSRASAGTLLTHTFIDSLVRGDRGAVTVLVAREGRVLVNKAYGVPDHPRYMPGTTVPNFPLGGIAGPIDALLKQLRRPGDTLTYAQQIMRYVGAPIGWRKTTVDSTGRIHSNVDELYRLVLGLEDGRDFRGADSTVGRNDAAGWLSDTFLGIARLSAQANSAGTQHALVRFPAQRISIIVLSDREDLDARGIAERIVERLLAQ